MNESTSPATEAIESDLRAAVSPEIYGKLARSVETAFNKTKFYGRLFRKRLRDRTIDAATIEEQFFDLPFTSKEDLVRNYPDGFLAVPRAEVAAVYESSGTSGDTTGSTKTVSYFTHRDLEADLARRYPADLALTADDVVAVALPYALTSSGIGFHLAAQRAGAMVVALDSGSIMSSHHKQLDIVRGLGVTVLVTAIPTILSTIALAGGEDPAEVFRALRAICLCGVPTLRGAMTKIGTIFEAEVYNTYGLSEFGATTYTCSSGEMHVHEDDFFVETLDPRTGEHSPAGRGGEIVVTTLTREASPRIRYRTGDFGQLRFGRCPCGSSAARLTVVGRLRDAVQLGSNFWLPANFEDVLLSHPATTGLYSLIYEAGEGQEAKVRVIADVTDPYDDGVRAAIVAALRQRLSINLEVELRAPGGTHPQMLDPRPFSAVRSMKTVLLDDRRPEEWLVSY
jgi:phenylacetate-CoA ligase